MSLFRYPLKTDWPFYLLVVGYLYTIGRMTLSLWFGDGINVFATYSDAVALDAVVLDANKVYWTKSGFLFSSLLLIALNLDVRAAFGIAATFWATASIVSFGATTLPVIMSLVNGLVLVGLQVYRGQVFAPKLPTGAAPGTEMVGSPAGVT